MWEYRLYPQPKQVLDLATTELIYDPWLSMLLMASASTFTDQGPTHGLPNITIANECND